MPCTLRPACSTRAGPCQPSGCGFSLFCTPNSVGAVPPRARIASQVAGHWAHPAMPPGARACGMDIRKLPVDSGIFYWDSLNKHGNCGTVHCKVSSLLGRNSAPNFWVAVYPLPGVIQMPSACSLHPELFYGSTSYHIGRQVLKRAPCRCRCR